MSTPPGRLARRVAAERLGLTTHGMKLKRFPTGGLVHRLIVAGQFMCVLAGRNLFATERRRSVAKPCRYGLKMGRGVWEPNLEGSTI